VTARGPKRPVGRRIDAPKPGRPKPIGVAWNTARRPLTDQAVRRIARAALAFGKRPGRALSVVFVSDRALARMHGRWLGDGAPTDVITFDLAEGAAGGPIGELYVSVERALVESRRRGVRPERELALYVVHGVLHLCGYDDHGPTDRRRMRAAERRVLEDLGFEHDPTPFP
jgi:probable rRNA maturation factor